VEDTKAEFRALYDQLEQALKSGNKTESIDLACKAAAFAIGGRDIGLDMSREEFDLVELLSRYHGRA
jgi:hypothetical protein